MWRRAFDIKLKKHTLFSIAQVIFFLVGGLIIISFSRQGVLLLKLNSILLDYFSWTAIFIPFVCLVSGLMFSKFHTPLNQPNVLVGGILFAVSAAGLTQGGIMGQEAWLAIAALVTTPGAAVIFFGGALIGVLVLFNASLDQIVALFLSLLVRLRHHILGTSKLAYATKLGGIKVSGGEHQSPVESKQTQPEKEKKETIANPAVNLPGESEIWDYPPLSLLSQSVSGKADRGDIKANAAIIEKTLESFGVQAKVVEVNLGPAVTQYAIEVALGTKLSKITGLANDLALALAAPSGQIRIEAPIPGRSLVGIELPNGSPEFVPLKRILESDAMRESKSKLTVALGLDVSGKPVVANLAKMPHALIAGQTGSGKSIAINTFISTLLFRASPNEVKFILVDPKRVELTGYNGVPHLLAPVITEPEKVISALKYLMSEMDRRYKMFAQVGARNVESYNEISGFQALPYIVLVIDELADIMLFSPVEVEDAVTRLAQMSRATGIHMVLATQRPSVDVLTGLIKANIPCRMAFAVSSLVDSRVILDIPGAEKLLGRGDMLFLPPDEAKPRRIQGAYISDNDTTKLIEFLRKTGIAPQYTEEVTTQPVRAGIDTTSPGGEKDELFDDAVRVVCGHDRASASLLQRRLAIGYARAARILDQLEARGIVGAADGSKPREILISSLEEYQAKENSK
ncbi:MAG: cell division FtsK/SpoIIIE [Microgenomates group bacterium GW2011_GWA2_39_19]|nr:MAG: cell division FtsK/SpoIIIE [Microgenomates group bacterium GW2011_GWA2_39_19]